MESLSLSGSVGVYNLVSGTGMSAVVSGLLVTTVAVGSPQNLGGLVEEQILYHRCCY
jgi:hypothetical protein